MVKLPHYIQLLLKQFSVKLKCWLLKHETQVLSQMSYIFFSSLCCLCSVLRHFVAP